MIIERKIIWECFWELWAIISVLTIDAFYVSRFTSLSGRLISDYIQIMAFSPPVYSPLPGVFSVRDSWMSWNSVGASAGVTSHFATIEFASVTPRFAVAENSCTVQLA